MFDMLKRQRFAVWGLGVSGVAAANLLAKLGKDVVASDSREHGPWVESLGLDPAVRLVLGHNVVGDAEIVVVSPGLKPTLPIFKSIPDSVPVVSEIDLAYQAARCDFVAITGTDGKTTTTALTAHILAEAKIPSIAGGNIGTPLSALVESFGEGSIIVAEISEFQLWSSSSFRAKATAFTNIAEDHLDYFQSMVEIAQAEHRIIENAGPDDVFIFNLEDPILDAWASESKHTRNFGISNRGVPNLWTNGAWVYEGEEPRIDLSKCLLQGRHNWLNIMAAAQIARVVGVEWRTISKAVMSFKPLPHRLELCGEINGVKFYDDSKATNAHAAVAGLNSLHGPLVVIAGGVEKGLPLDVMAETLQKRAEAVLVIGEIQSRMCDVFRAANVPGVEEATTLENAVIRAFELAQVARASVVLSPACSSFDMFKSYAHRGEVFQASVKALED